MPTIDICFTAMVCQNLCQAHLQEVGLTQILADHDSETIVNGWHGYFNVFVQQ